MARMEQAIERAIARAAVSALIAGGFLVTVFDCEEYTLTDSGDVESILAAVFTTDDDRLYVRKVAAETPATHDSEFFGWVWFVYGNSGWDVISDYTTNLESLLEPVNAFAEEIDSGIFEVAPLAAGHPVRVKWEADKAAYAVHLEKLAAIRAGRD